VLTVHTVQQQPAQQQQPPQPLPPQQPQQQQPAQQRPVKRLKQLQLIFPSRQHGPQQQKQQGPPGPAAAVPGAGHVAGAAGVAPGGQPQCGLKVQGVAAVGVRPVVDLTAGGRAGAAGGGGGAGVVDLTSND
jgi:hypothetical protein